MKLVDYTDSMLEILLPEDILWTDEFNWVAVEASKTYAVGGALVIQKATKLKGRPITLSSPDASMGWITREDLLELKTWADDSTKKMVLHLEKPSDTRTFTVQFDIGEPVRTVPVLGFANHELGEFYTLTIKLIETV